MEPREVNRWDNAVATAAVVVWMLLILALNRSIQDTIEYKYPEPSAHRLIIEWALIAGMFAVVMAVYKLGYFEHVELGLLRAVTPGTHTAPPSSKKGTPPPPTTGQYAISIPPEQQLPQQLPQQPQTRKSYTTRW